MLEAVTRLWEADEPVSYEGRYYRYRDISIQPQPSQRPRPPIWIGGGTQPSKLYAQPVDRVRPVLRRIAQYADAWVPHSSATAEMVTEDWAIVQEEMATFGRSPRDMTRVYSNFVHVLEPGQSPEAAAERFRVFSGMDLDYWQSYYLLGEAEEVAERIRAKVQALGGVDQVILNPLDWDINALDRLARDVLPLVTD
jgi:alkanesulfonate monooxygenase SsuD/methylene tetrahydromethanopterin reductase-like flavin-dependent oxidoreductase (luciferase family)